MSTFVITTKGFYNENIAEHRNLLPEPVI